MPMVDVCPDENVFLGTWTNGKTDGKVVGESDTRRMRMRSSRGSAGRVGGAVRPPVDRSLLPISVPAKPCSIMYRFTV